MTTSEPDIMKQEPFYANFEEIYQTLLLNQILNSQQDNTQSLASQIAKLLPSVDKQEPEEDAEAEEEKVFKTPSSPTPTEDFTSTQTLDLPSNCVRCGVNEGICLCPQDIKSSLYDRLQQLSNETFKCDYADCDYEAKVESNLKMHIDTVHLKKKIYQCDQCEYHTCDKRPLMRHIRSVHLKLKNYFCNHCSFTAFRKSGLNYHIQNVHLKKLLLSERLNGNGVGSPNTSGSTGPDGKHWKCEHCPFEAFTKMSLSSHMKVHQKKDFKCTLCDFKTTGNTRLQIHVAAVHLKLKRFKCPICDYAAAEKFNLKVHVESVHYNLKTAQCGQCSYKAYNQRLLQKHTQNIHQNPKRLKNVI